MEFLHVAPRPNQRYQKKIIFNAGVEASINYAEPTDTYTPRIQLLFSPFGLPFVPIEIVASNIQDIINELTWYKDRNNPGGMLQLELAPDPATIKEIVKIINKFSGNLYSKIWGELGVDLEDLLKPMTLCQLWIDGYHVMTGTVRACSRSASVANNQKEVTYSVIIEELGNVYNYPTMSLDFITKDAIQIQITDAIKTALELVANIKTVTLALGIQLLIQAFKLTTLGVGWTLSDGFPISLRLLSLANPLGAIGNLSFANNLTIDSAVFQMQNGASGQPSMWDFLKGIMPNPWMEFYTESGGRTIVTEALGAPGLMFPGFNYIVARSVPYSNPLIGIVNPAKISETLPFDITALQMLIGGDFVIITDQIVENKELGYDCINQKTVFNSFYTAKGVTQATDFRDKGIKSVGPLNPFASGGLPTFGIREMFQTIDAVDLQYLGTASSYVAKIAKATVGLPTQIMSKGALNNLLAVWFRNQSRFREGTVTTRQMPYARPGMYCLYLPSLKGNKVENVRDIGIYYIDSLIHNYKLENKSVKATTTFNLIRGVPLPASIAQTALLLFDFEILPPQSGLADGEYRILQALRRATSLI